MTFRTPRLALPAIALFAALPASASGVVLDDYSSDANFIAGKYTFYEVANWYGRELVSSVTVSDGTLKIDNVGSNGAPLWAGATTAQMWNAGEALRRVGDAVSVDLTGVAVYRTAGLFIDGDLLGRENGAELRWSGYNNDLVVTELGPDGDGVNSSVAPTPYGLVADWSAVEMTMLVRLVGKDETNLYLTTEVSSETFPTLTENFSIPGSEAYFGPVAWANGTDVEFPPQDGVRSEHDNLTFIPFVPDLGDMDGDGTFDNADIAPFVQALTDPEAYAAAFPGLDPDVIADFDQSGTFTNADIAGFVDALTGGSSLTAEQAAYFEAANLAVPEPSSLALLGLGGLIALRRRRMGNEQDR